MVPEKRPYTQPIDRGGQWTYDQARGLYRWACAADQWQTVLGAAGPGVALLAQADLDAAREEFNEAASDYRALIFHHRARFVKDEDSPALAWRKRRKRLEAALQGTDEDANAVFRLLVNQAIDYADAAIAGYEMEGSTHHGRSPERDRLYSRLLEIWTKRFEGPLTTGRSPGGKRVADSPAIRFLLATLAPILDADDMIGPEAAKKIVDAEIKRRAQMPEMVASWKAGLTAMKQRAKRRRSRGNKAPRKKIL